MWAYWSWAKGIAIPAETAEKATGALEGSGPGAGAAMGAGSEVGAPVKSSFALDLCCSKPPWNTGNPPLSEAAVATGNWALPLRSDSASAGPWFKSWLNLAGSWDEGAWLKLPLKTGNCLSVLFFSSLASLVLKALNPKLPPKMDVFSSFASGRAFANVTSKAEMIYKKKK